MSIFLQNPIDCAGLRVSWKAKSGRVSALQIFRELTPQRAKALKAILSAYFTAGLLFAQCGLTLLIVQEDPDFFSNILIATVALTLVNEVLRIVTTFAFKKTYVILQTKTEIVSLSGLSLRTFDRAKIADFTASTPRLPADTEVAPFYLEAQEVALTYDGADKTLWLVVDPDRAFKIVGALNRVATEIKEANSHS